MTTIERIEVGDRVRSMDFEHVDDCFVEGVVLRIRRQIHGCDRYEILVARQVIQGAEVVGHRSLVGEKVYPPINGVRNSMTGNPTNFVHRIQ